MEGQPELQNARSTIQKQGNVVTCFKREWIRPWKGEGGRDDKGFEKHQPGRDLGERWPPARNYLKTTAWIVRETPAWRASETEEQVLRGKS